MSMSARLKRGRESYRRRAWGEAYQWLSLADQATRLAGDDLEFLAMAAYMIGLDDQYLNALERAQSCTASAESSPQPKRPTKARVSWVGTRNRVWHCCGWRKADSTPRPQRFAAP
jgi:hypothetical protein